jgi:hypothetical protein
MMAASWRKHIVRLGYSPDPPRDCVKASSHRFTRVRDVHRRGIIFLTMKIVRILGKIAENLPRTCAKSTALNEPRLQWPLLACPQQR